MKELISVIVPVYNSAQYIPDCVGSVLEQSYTYFELILIDDGSSDNSRAICEEMMEADRRIRFLAQSHKGVSAARNAGIKAAEGDYLFFLDSDDMIHPELLKSLYLLLKKKSAVIAAEYYCLSEKDWHSLRKQNAGSGGVCEYTHLDRQKTMEALLDGNQEAFTGIGGKMVRRDMAETVQFDEDLMNGEDTKYIYQLFAKGADAVTLHQSWYYYRENKDGASKKNTVRTYQSRYKSIRYICDQEKESGRTLNAVYWETYIVECLADWYTVSRQTGDRESADYLRGLAQREKRSDIFSQIDWNIRMYFYLALYGYPLRRISHKLKNIRKRYGRKNK